MTNNSWDNSYVQVLLDQWGRYCRQVAPTRLGYPSHSAYATPSPSAFENNGLSDSEESQARRMDRVLAAMKQQDKAAYSALEQIYLWKLSAVESAARIGVSRGMLYTLRSRGESYVAGAVSNMATERGV